MELTIYQVDAFANEVFRGNPAAIIPLTEWLDDDLMQQIALENNLSETAFFVPEGEGYHLRWFTPTKEVDLCGHATVASAHVLYQHLGLDQAEIAFQSRSGLLTVRHQNKHYTLNFPTDKLTLIQDTNLQNQLQEAFGAKPLQISKGREDWLVLFESQEQIARLQPDFRKMAELDGRGVLATAPGEDVDFVSRCFFPNYGVDEDPVTGSAHTTLIPFWAERLGKNELTARQISQRGGDLMCKLLGERVAISGDAVTYLIGKIFL